MWRSSCGVTTRAGSSRMGEVQNSNASSHMSRKWTAERNISDDGDGHRYRLENRSIVEELGYVVLSS